MASKRRISYQWQLFIPLVLTLWVIIVGMTFWQFYNEREYRKSQINEQLSLVSSRILYANETDVDARPFMKFAVDYYRDNPLYDLLRITVYKDGRMIHCYGAPIALSDSERALERGVTETPGVDSTAGTPDAGKYFYYSVRKSKDGRVTVYTVLPFDNDILAASLPSTRIFWIMFAIALVATIVAYYSTRYFGRNITNLRKIAERASTDPNFMPAMEYPHDELGDISRQITTMYNQRSQAMQRQKKEHAVALHAIEEKARAKRQLTNNINHELRTPIGVIKGYIDTILENPTMDENSRTHFLTKASEHVDRLVNLIADVSAITRLEEGGELISTEELDFHDIAYTISNDIEESGDLGKMEFRYDIPLDCKVMGNYNLLLGMILNLAKNAGAYSKGTFCELVLTGQDEKFYHFEFRDNGTGVGEEHLPHLFDRFYRIDSGRTRKAGGTGLGLPIVQNTVLAHGGTIEVTNGVLGGLCFKFTLPKVRNRK
ncbi:MAG: HAMP domain-containing histidine kinase [Muribaculaceae bacterium]|nr:HAMP domain-containing histidine kinase [Muribaculaceae bacterium]